MAVELGKLRDMSPDELLREERQLREAIWKLRLQVATGQLHGPQQVKRVGRDLARVLTVRRERELATRRG